MNRTDAEILERIEFMKNHDVAGMTLGDLSALMPFTALEGILTPRVVARIKERGAHYAAIPPRDPETMKNKIIEYLPHAWIKANDANPLAVSRNLLHFSNLLWLMGDDDLAAYLLRPYSFFSKPQLVKVSERVGIDWRKLDDDVWISENLEEALSADEALKVAA